MERRTKIALAAATVTAALLVLLWLARAWIAERVALRYFASHGIASQVEIGDLGLSGLSGSFALGPAEAPEISARRIELHFDPLSLLPRVVEVRLVDPVIRARLDAEGHITLPSLQAWIDSLTRAPGKSRWVSDDLAVAMTGLDAQLTTPAGPLRLGGDLKLVRNLPVVAHLAVRPATIAWNGTTFVIRAARLDYDVTGRLRLHATGDLRRPALAAEQFVADARADGLRWTMAEGAFTLAVPSLHLTAAAASVTAGRSFAAPKLELTVQDGEAVLRDGTVTGRGEISGDAQAGLDPALADMVRAQDPALAQALRRNLARMTLSFAALVARDGTNTALTFRKPLLLTGAEGARLTAVSTDHDAWHVTLAGHGLPGVTLDLRHLATGDGFAADARLSARFDYAGLLKGAALAGGGALAWRDRQLTFKPSACLHVAAAAFTSLARKVSADLCPAGPGPMLSADAQGWHFHAGARNAGAFLPLPNAGLSQASGLLDFTQTGGKRRGSIAVTDAVLGDRAPSPRYRPLHGTGTITLAGNRWQGSLTARNNGSALGRAAFSHDMRTGAGSAHIAADGLVFAPDKLQPADLSPLLAALKRAEGKARFSGDIGWGRSGFTSKGELAVDALDFMTPLGKAHAVKTDIRFTSLLPPVTAPDQTIAIDRIDWTLPFSAMAVSFALGANAVTVGRFDTDIAQGHATLGGTLTVKLDDPNHLSGTMLFAHVSLQSLIAASNLADKVKTEGTLSGAVPFSLTPEGFRITDGHIAADRPGRLSINRAVWAQGDAAISSNAVQDFAYQAMENLAFDKLTADLKSVPGGRLQIVFHLVGKSDPPAPQEARVSISDILNGTALYKPIPLPSGTPIDLTLDTSLNFDELLKSYAEAWSKSLSPGGEDGAGAKP